MARAQVVNPFRHEQKVFSAHRDGVGSDGADARAGGLKRSELGSGTSIRSRLGQQVSGGAQGEPWREVVGGGPVDMQKVAGEVVRGRVFRVDHVTGVDGQLEIRLAQPGKGHVAVEGEVVHAEIGQFTGIVVACRQKKRWA